MKSPGRLRRVRLLGDEIVSPVDRDLFLALHRLRVVNEYEDGAFSQVYHYETVTRDALDAVVLCLLATVDGERSICLRSSVRPPLLLRAGLDLPISEEGELFSLWELPAGLLEPGDEGEEGVRCRAAAEAFEETGYYLEPACFEIWPGPSFPTSGVIPERMIFLTATIEDAGDCAAASGDGSPAEDGAELRWIAIDEALAMCDRGEIWDMKTELGIRRVAMRM